MKYIDLTKKVSGGSGDNAQLFNFKWAKQAPNNKWVEANGEWVTNNENAYNKLVQDAQGINSKFVYTYGTPVITDEQVVSGFGNGNYLRTDIFEVPSLSSDTDVLEIITKVTPDNFNNDWNIVLRIDTGKCALGFQKNTGKPSAWIYNSWRIGSTSYQNNQTIWLKLTCKKQGTSYTNYTLSSLLDNNYDLSTLPDNDWVQEWSGAFNPFDFEGVHQYDFGYNIDVLTEYLNGSISLNDTRVKFNDNILWLLHYNPRLNDNNFYVVPIKSENDINIIDNVITLKNTTLNFYAILDENNHRFVLPQADYYIPDTDMKLYFYLG